MKKGEYQQYLQSDHWRDLRKKVLRDCTGCEMCGVPRWLASIAYDQDLHLHHLTYANLGKEDRNDLQVLCARCHEIETFGRSDLRRLKTAECEFCASEHYDVYSRVCEKCVGLLQDGLHWMLDWKLPGKTTTLRHHLRAELKKKSSPSRDEDVPF